MTAARVLAAGVLAAAMLSGIGWLSRAPYAHPRADTGLLRLSWRWRTEREETCRPRTQAELEALPVHMRTPEICEGRLAAYRLIFAIDDAPADTVLVLPGGARADRPVYVFREVRLPPGPHRVHVQFERADIRSGSTPLTFDAVLSAEPGSIELVTIDPTTRTLVHATPASP